MFLASVKKVKKIESVNEENIRNSVQTVTRAEDQSLDHEAVRQAVKHYLLCHHATHSQINSQILLRDIGLHFLYILEWGATETK